MKYKVSSNEGSLRSELIFPYFDLTMYGFDLQAQYLLYLVQGMTDCHENPLEDIPARSMLSSSSNPHSTVKNVNSVIKFLALHWLLECCMNEGE